MIAVTQSRGVNCDTSCLKLLWSMPGILTCTIILLKSVLSRVNEAQSHLTSWQSLRLSRDPQTFMEHYRVHIIISAISLLQWQRDMQNCNEDILLNSRFRISITSKSCSLLYTLQCNLPQMEINFHVRNTCRKATCNPTASWLVKFCTLVCHHRLSAEIR